jgi:hypothetical protein
MIEKNTLQKLIGDILVLCDKANAAKYGSDSYKASNKALWNAIFALDKGAHTGLHSVAPGRYVQFPHQGGYARYIVTKVGKVNCKVTRLPWADGYKFHLESDKGEIETKTIESALAQEDIVSKLFNADAGERANALLVPYREMPGHAFFPPVVEIEV